MPSIDHRILRFADFELDRDALELRRGAQRLHLQVQPFRLLETLIEHPGRVFSREELRNRVWPSNVYVDFDHGLNNAVAKLRETLGDSANRPKFIETLPRVGYRFIFPAEQIFAVRSGSDERAPAAGPPERSDWSQPSLRPDARPAPRQHRLGIAGLMVIAAALVTVVIDIKSDGAPAPAYAVNSVAVLPVRDLSANADQEYFAAGMTEAMITRLAQSTSLRVVSRRSGERYRDAAVPIADIARDLKVDSVLDSSLFRDGDDLRIDVQLIRAADDSHAWAKSYTRKARDVFQLQRDLADDIAREIVGHDASQASASVAQSADLEAYELYLQGRHLWNQRSPDSVTRSLARFQRAAELDRSFAAAFAGIAEAYALLGGNSLVKTLPVADVREPALAAARHALELDPELPEAHSALARVLAMQPTDPATFSQIEEHYRKALALNPAYSEARLGLGNFLSQRGRRDEAIAEFRECLRRDPLSPNNMSRLGKELVDAGNPEEGILLLERAIEIEPWQFNSLVRLGWIYAALNRFEEARAAFSRAEQVTPGTIHTLAGRAFVDASAGDAASATQLIEAIKAQSDQIDQPNLLAFVYVALGDRDHALEWLEKSTAILQSNQRQGLFSLDAPMYDWLRDDPRFTRLLANVSRRVDPDESWLTTRPSP